MRSVTVSLGGKEYEVKQLPMRAESEWRKSLQAQLEPVLVLVRGYEQIEFNGPADVVAFVEQLAPLLLGATDIVLELLFAYSPELALLADEIETACYSDEVMEALKAVLGLAYPFVGDLAKLAQAGQKLMANGAAPKPLPTT